MRKLADYKVTEVIESLNPASFVSIPASATFYDLTPAQLIIYGVIHGYTKDGQGMYFGSINYLCQWTNLSDSNVRRNLKVLIKKGAVKQIKRSGLSDIYTISEVTPPILGGHPA